MIRRASSAGLCNGDPVLVSEVAECGLAFSRGPHVFARAVDSKIDEFTALKKRVEKLEKAFEGLCD
jgi:hypothetical protein